MTLCDYCQKQEATTKCNVCGSMICEEHSLEYGCKVCGGGEQKI